MGVLSSKSKKFFMLFVALIILVLIFLATGCAASKKAYEDRMVSILKRAKTDLDNNHKELAKVDREKSSKKRDQKKKDLVEKQIEVLEETRDDIKNVSAPDDLYSGHSDLIEFLQLLIESREATFKNIGKKESAKSSQTGSEAFKTFQHSGRAFSRASSELPFLEYELRDTFETVLQDVQMDVQQQSGFGQPPPGSGTPSGPGRTVP